MSQSLGSNSTALHVCRSTSRFLNRSLRVFGRAISGKERACLPVESWQAFSTFPAIRYWRPMKNSSLRASSPANLVPGCVWTVLHRSAWAYHDLTQNPHAYGRDVGPTTIALLRTMIDACENVNPSYARRRSACASTWRIPRPGNRSAYARIAPYGAASTYGRDRAETSHGELGQAAHLNARRPAPREDNHDPRAHE